MTGPPAAVARLRVAVRRALAELVETPPDAGSVGGGAAAVAGAERTLVLVACSGGPDSMALAAATAFVAPRLGLRAGLVTVDHGLQDGSAERAATVAGWARAVGLEPVEIATVTVDVTDGGPEGAAREARYAALAEAAQRLQAAAILLGHTRDDQAETVLLALARGSGPRALAAMPVRRGLLLRPLLDVPRADTIAACRELELPTWDDPHNTDPAYTRSRLRAAMPRLIETFGPRVVANLARTAELVAADTEALDSYAADLLRAARVPGPVAGSGGSESADIASEPERASLRPRGGGRADFVGEPDPADPLPHGGGQSGGLAAEPERASLRPRGGSGADGPVRERGANATSRAGGGETASPLAVAPLAAAHRAVRSRALRAWVLDGGADADALSYVHITGMDALVTDWHGQGPVHLPGRITVRRRGAVLRLARGAG